MPALATHVWPAREGLAARLVALLTHTTSAAAVGRAYLAQSPHEARADRLVAAITSGWTGTAPGAAWQSASKPELLELVRMKIVDDFAREEVAILDGWIVSRTEARLCGLVLLATEGARSV
ncbi:MAG TPA: hypothetical protein VMP67_05075 [Candidatus Limnocylindria bacterium]|nr:hypothetical protein [Candidatus Limnocylindria bacterium]